jgi:hypothetical protein
MAAIVVLSMAACGGDGGGSPSAVPSAEASAAPAAAAYASGVCNAVLDWVDSVQTRSTGFSTEAQSATSLDQVKQLFVDYLDTTVQDTHDMVSVIGALGVPDIDGGQEVQTALLGVFRQFETTFSDALDQARNLSTTDQTTFMDGVTQISDDIDTKLSSVTDPLDSLSNPELEAAGNADPDCRKLGS